MPSQAIVGIILVLGGLAASVALAMTGRPMSSVIASVVVAGLGILAHVSWARAHGEVKRLRADMKVKAMTAITVDNISPPAEAKSETDPFPETPKS